MSCPFCDKKAHPNAIRDLEDDHQKLHEYWNSSFLHTACHTAGRRNTLRTCNKYASQLGFFIDDSYRAIHDKPQRQSNVPVLFRFIKHLVKTGRIVDRPKSILKLLTDGSFVKYLTRARVDREKNESGETITVWHTLEIVDNKKMATHMPHTNLSRRLDSKNSIRSPLTHYARSKSRGHLMSKQELELVQYKGLLAKHKECTALTALREATVPNLISAVYKRKRALEPAPPPKRAKIAGLINMPQFNGLECIVPNVPIGTTYTCRLPSGDVVDIQGKNLVFSVEPSPTAACADVR
jgi:hypothetical protein